MPRSNESSGLPQVSADARTSLPAAAVRLLIRLYRWVVSPVLGPACRFEPSCSHYADQAIARYGLVTGSFRAVRRLLRCHPWNPGGYDPVR